MSEYRPIKTKIWHDEWFCTLNPEERCFWLFLLTNEYVQISGIYELPKPLISPLSGCSEGLKILEKFIQQDKVKYKNGFLFIKNYLRNQTKQLNKKDNIIKSITTYLSENPQLIEWFDLQNEAPYKELTIPLPKVINKESNKDIKIERESSRFASPSLEEQIKPIENQYAPSMITDFMLYWNEQDLKGTPRWKKEKTWQVELRLQKWKRQQDKWDYEKQKVKTEELPKRDIEKRTEGFTKLFTKV